MDSSRSIAIERTIARSGGAREEVGRPAHGLEDPNAFQPCSRYIHTPPARADSGRPQTSRPDRARRVLQSGQYQASRRRISKRGSPFLRRTPWNMAHRACYQEGELRDYFLRRKAQGMHHLAAVTAVAVKLCPIVWRIMTDRRDYQPQRPVTKP